MQIATGLHNEELNSMYHPPNITQSRRLRWAGHVTRMEEGKSALKTGTPTGKKTFKKAY